MCCVRSSFVLFKDKFKICIKIISFLSNKYGVIIYTIMVYYCITFALMPKCDIKPVVF